MKLADEDQVPGLLQGKLPGLFAAITCKLLGDLPVSGAGDDYELIVRRTWEKIRQLFGQYDVCLTNEAELVKLGLSADFLMKQLPQGFQFEYNSADLLQYTPLIHVDSPEPGQVAGMVSRVHRAYHGDAWHVTIGFWNLTLKIPDQMVLYGDPMDLADGKVVLKDSNDKDYTFRLFTRGGSALSRDRLNERIAKRQMPKSIEGTND